jgi:hypothetical protein
MKRLGFLFCLVFLLVGAMFIAGGGEFSGRVDERILERFDSGEEKVRVVVSLKEEVVERKGVGVFSKEVVEKVDRGEVIEKAGIKEKVRHEFIYSNSFSAELSLEELEELEKDGGIDRIYYDYPVTTFLQNSTKIIGANETWGLQINGINLTGEGQTVCVIDTGINSSHESLQEKIIVQKCFISHGSVKCEGNMNEGNSAEDVHGHGTHVAGIISSSTHLKGVSPGANLAIVKASNDSGVGYSVDVGKSMEWCVLNRQQYNISVISMSLGGGQNNSFCDSGNYLTYYVNLAVSENISVVVATGNKGLEFNDIVAGISSPACITNSTRITALDKDETYADYAFRNSNFSDILSAPGTSINSTIVSGSYNTNSGTSMATPHVSGAIAILRQYLDSINKTMTPKNISDVLNRTGKQIEDSASGRNYSRIDVYAALIELDETPPSVNLISPEDLTINLSKNQTFFCNATDWQLKNATLYLWNSLGEIYNNSLTNEISGTENQTEFNLTEIEYGKYEWNCLVCDENSNCDFTESNFSLFVMPENVLTRHFSPEENYETNKEQGGFICESFSGVNLNLTNTTLDIFYVQNEINISLFNSTTKNIQGNYNLTEFSVNFTDAEEGNYSWSCLVYNNESNYFLSENRTLIYDITPPTLVGNVGKAPEQNSVTISFNTDEPTNSSIELFGKQNKSSDGNYSLNHSYSFSSLTASTSYSFNITFCDRAENCNFTEGDFKTKDPLAGGGNTGGSTTSFSSPPPSTPEPEPAEEEIMKEGKTVSSKEGEKISFKIKNNSHSLETIEVKENWVMFILRSEPINISLFVREEKKISLNSEGYYDFYIRLNSIENGSVNLTIKEIYEKIDLGRDVVLQTFEDEEEQKFSFSEKEKRMFFIGLGIFILLIILVSWIFKKLDRRIPNEKKKEEKSPFYFFQHK